MKKSKTVYASNLFTTLGILLLSFLLLGVAFASITYSTTIQTERRSWLQRTVSGA